MIVVEYDGIDNHSASEYTTDNYKTVFQFLNSNWVILSTNINYYVKINQLSIFTLEFYDQENDRIVIILEQYDEIGLYSQQDPSSKQKVNMYLQANSYSENPINIIANYHIRRCLVPTKRPTLSQIREGDWQRWFLLFKICLNFYNFFIKRATGGLFYYYGIVFK